MVSTKRSISTICNGVLKSIRDRTIMPRGQRNHVYVEINPDSGLPVRILKSLKQAMNLADDLVRYVDRTWAVGEIRRQVFERDGYECQRCSARLTLQTGHMDEYISRGEGGEISVTNSWLLCYTCHEGDKPTSEHGNRRIRFGEVKVK